MRLMYSLELGFYAQVSQCLKLDANWGIHGTPIPHCPRSTSSRLTGCSLPHVLGSSEKRLLGDLRTPLGNNWTHHILLPGQVSCMLEM